MRLKSRKKESSGGVEVQPEPVGQEAMAAQAVGLEPQLQLLDAVF